MKLTIAAFKTTVALEGLEPTHTILMLQGAIANETSFPKEAELYFKKVRLSTDGARTLSYYDINCGDTFDLKLQRSNKK